MATPRFSVFIATSVDGFIARPDGDVDWLQEVGAEDLAQDDGGFADFFAAVDVLVMGRNTFEKVLSFDGPWPYGDKPVVVLSRTLAEVPDELRETVSIEACTPSELAHKLGERGLRRVYLDGGQVIQSFLREGLVSDLTVTRIAVLLGQGLPLFGELPGDIRLRLLDTRSWGECFEQSRYEVVN